MHSSRPRVPAVQGETLTFSKLIYCQLLRIRHFIHNVFHLFSIDLRIRDLIKLCKLQTLINLEINQVVWTNIRLG